MADPPAEDGWPAAKVFDGVANGYGFDDLVLLPGHTSFEASDADLASRLSRNVSLNTPLVGAPSETVTGTEMAVALALAGGVGFVHPYQEPAAQAEMVRRAKRWVCGFILEPATLGPEGTVADLERLQAERGISGVPITDNGKLGGKLVGIATARDADSQQDKGRALQRVMVKDVVTAREPVSIEEAMAKMRKAKVGKLPIIDEEGHLVSMITSADMKKTRAFPKMSRDAKGQLLVGASVLAGAKDDMERARLLCEAGVDVLCVDVRGSHSDRELELIKRLKADFPSAEVIAGPAVNCREAKRLLDAGADGLVVGGDAPPGGHGAAMQFAAVARPEATSTYEVARYARLTHDLPVIAGSDVRDVGQALKALALGASCVMLGDLLAGAAEAPCAPRLVGGSHLVKPNRRGGGLGAESLPARRHGAAQAVPRGVCSQAPCNGSAKEIVPFLCSGLQHGLTDLGTKSVEELHAALDKGDLRMEVRAPFSMQLLEEKARALEVAARPEVMMNSLRAR